MGGIVCKWVWMTSDLQRIDPPHHAWWRADVCIFSQSATTGMIQTNVNTTCAAAADEARFLIDSPWDSYEYKEKELRLRLVAFLSPHDVITTIVRWQWRQDTFLQAITFFTPTVAFFCRSLPEQLKKEMNDLWFVILSLFCLQWRQAPVLADQVFVV